MEATTTPTATRTYDAKGNATVTFGNLGNIEDWSQKGKAAARCTHVVFCYREAEGFWRMYGLRANGKAAMAEARNATVATARRVNPSDIALAVAITEG